MMNRALAVASLVMKPEGYNDGSLPSLIPRDRSGDFTFTRGSNLAATRVNQAGLIEKGRENLLTYSNDFSQSDWNKTGILSVTGGEVGYDGLNDAYLITSNASTSNHYLRQSGTTQSGVQTYSVYAKGNGYDVQLRATGIGTTANWVSFNLISGSVGTSGAGIIESKMTSLGDGWYRCSAAFNDSGSPFIGIYMVEDADTAGSGPSYTGDDVSGVFLQDTQIEQGLVATDYIESGATTAQAGILENTPRLGYSGGATEPSLLLEPSRTNLVGYSEYQSSTIYGNQNVSIADNVVMSPEGLQNAAKIILDSGTNTSNGGHYYPFSSTAGTNYTISVFAKAGEMRYFTFTYGSSAAAGGHFDLQEGTLLGTITNGQYSNESAFIEDYGNGWYRLVVSLTDNASVNGRYLSMKPSPSASVPSNNNYQSTGDGVSGAYIYGFQLEVSASYATSYIPTYGTSVTRAYDYIKLIDLQSKGIITASQGTFLIEMDNYNFNAVQLDVQNPDLFYALRPTFRQTAVDIYQRVNNIQTSVRNITGLPTGRRIVAISWNGTSLITSVNGVSYTDTIDGSIAAELFKIDRPNFNGTFFDLNQLLMFPTQLTEAELNALTTI